MGKRISRFWISFTVVLSVVFAVVFFPIVRDKFFLTDAILLTLAGIAIIWGVYFLRAAIVSRAFWREHD